MKRRHRKMKKYLLCFISVLIVTITVIYAQESDINLDIFGNSIVSTNNANFNVHFVSNNVTVNGTGTATVTDSTTAEINASGLSVKDDEFEAVFVVKNDSKGVAAEFDLSLTATDTDVIQVTKTISKKQLAAGESATVTVNVLLLETIFETDLSTTFSGTIVAKPIDSINNTSPTSVIGTEESRFSTYNWSKIKQDIDENKTDKYTVGDERTITIGNKQYRLRLANTEVTSDCSGANFSETSCGFIVEFIDMPTTSAMLPSTETTTDLGYENSLARQYLTGTLYDSLPSDLKSVISTTKVVSGHNKNINSNYVTYDKLFLLSPTELGIYKYYDSTKDLTRTLDYYENSSSNHNLRIKYSNNRALYYWTRTPQLDSETAFYHVNNDGRMAAQNFTTARGIAPAFRIKKENR